MNATSVNINTTIKNKYNLEISNKLLNQYYNDLIGEFFKILPISEGLDFKTKKVIYSIEEAHIQYLKYVKNFIYEICGGYYLFEEDSYFLKLLTILEGMLIIQINEHDEIKPLVFNCIAVLKKLKLKLNER